MSTSMTEQLAKRKEINLRKKALRGDDFEGSAEIRKQYHKRRKKAARKAAVTKKMNSPEEIFKRDHSGLTEQEYQILLSKGLTLEDLEFNKDGTPNRWFKSGGSEGCFKNRLRNLRKKYRREGLPEKSEQTTNHQPRTISNPLGSGAPVHQVQVSKQLKVSTEVLETCNKVLANVVDWEALPGFYDTKYTPDTKIHAVTSYVVTGSFKQAAKLAVVPESTIKGWKGTEWFRTIARYVQQARAEELDSSMSNVIHQAMEAVHDRLTEGDTKYNPRLNEVVRVPVSAKDATLIADRVIHSRNLLRGDATSRTENTSLAEKIMDLRQQFKTFTDKNVIEVERVPDEERE